MTPQEFTDAVAKAMKKNKCKVDLGEGQINIVYVEGMNRDFTRNKNEPNRFNDLRCVFRAVKGKLVLAGRWEATTEPSRRWTESPMNPEGAARIRFGQQQCWQQGYHHGDKNHEALVQTGGPVEVYRDRNKDYDRDGDKLDKGEFGINQHHGYDLPEDDLRGSSAGCLVGRTRAGHAEFMSVVKSDPRYRADPRYIFSTTVMPAGWLLGSQVPTGVPPAARTASEDTPGAGLISEKAETFIVEQEVEGEHEYNERYHRPTWPGGSSGVTVGIGYDLGASTDDPDVIRKDWLGELPGSTIEIMATCAGIQGQAARRKTAEIAQFVSVPWHAALHVFRRVTIPRYYNLTRQKLENFDELPLDCKGALVSLTYNRGASYGAVGDRYREMNNIKVRMAEKDFKGIPDEIRGMKRLWVGKGLDGLLKRRDAEAKMFEDGLKEPSVVEKTVMPTAAGGGLAAGMTVIAKWWDQLTWGETIALGVACLILFIGLYYGIKSLVKR